MIPIRAAEGRCAVRLRAAGRRHRRLAAWMLTGVVLAAGCMPPPRQSTGLVLRIEPAGADWSGTEIPLSPVVAAIVSEGEPVPPDAGIRSPFNACCFRDACRELLAALDLIVANPDHDLLPTERQTAVDAIRKATGQG